MAFDAWPARPWASIAGLLLALMPAMAVAELTGLVYEEAEDRLLIASIDASSGAVSPGAAALDNCCRLVAGLTATDPDGGRLFAIGLDPDTQAPQLLIFSLDGSAAAAIELSQMPQALLAYDAAADRLISASLTGPPEATSQWISIDPDSGAITPIGSPNEGCCEILTGLAAIAGNGQQLYLLGRQFGETDWQLLGVDLGDATVTLLAQLPVGRPGFLAREPGSGQLDVLMQTTATGTSTLHRIDPASGNVTLIASQADADCCLVLPGQAASLDASGQIWWIGGSGSGLVPGAGFFALRAESDGASLNPRQLVAGYRLNALLVDGEIINLDLIFRDRFEP